MELGVLALGRLVLVSFFGIKVVSARLSGQELAGFGYFNAFGVRLIGLHIEWLYIILILMIM